MIKIKYLLGWVDYFGPKVANKGFTDVQIFYLLA